MLRLIPTEHKKGVKLQGDYNDLNALYDALGNYLEFYQVCTDYPYSDYEYLLALNYDIRHAYMGTRDYAAVDNHYSEYELVMLENDDSIEYTEEDKKKLKDFKKNFRDKNLYFSVDIALPLILYYACVFQKMLDTGYTELWFKKYNKDKDSFHQYTPLKAEMDLAQMNLYNADVFTYLKNLLGESDTDLLFKYLTYNEEGMIFPASYIDALLAYYMENAAVLEGEDLKAFIIYTAYCVFDPVSTSKKNRTFRPCHDQYHNAWNQIKDKVTKRMPSYTKFIQLENKFFGNKQEISWDEFEDFLSYYFGNPDWDNMVW